MIKILILIAGLFIIVRILFKWKIVLFTRNLTLLIWQMGLKDWDDWE